METAISDDRTLRAQGSAAHSGKGAKYLRFAFIGVTCFSALYQLLIYTTIVNAICTIVAAASGSFAYFYTLRERTFRWHPMSSLSILGFAITTNPGALVLTTLTGREVTYGLQEPYTTFFMLAAVQTWIIVCHYMYVNSPVMQAVRRGISTGILRRLGAFSLPTQGQLWIMGAIGIGAVISSHTGDFYLQPGQASENFIGKFAQGFIFLAVAPFLIPVLGPLHEMPGGTGRALVPKLIAYFVCLLLAGFLSNSRATFFYGLATIGLTLLLSIAIGKVQLKGKSVFKSVMALVIIVPAFAQLSDLSTAMVIARSQRAEITGGALISATWDTYTNKTLIREAQQAASSLLNIGFYSEDYIPNPVLARLIFTKFHDNMFYYSSRFKPADSAMLRQSFYDKVITFLPTPVLNFLGFNFNKEDMLYSTGDYIFYLDQGYGLGSFILGSMVADGWAMWGIGFFAVLFLMAIGSFIIHDSFVYKNRYKKLIFSPVILMQSWAVAVTYFGSESVANAIGALFRAIPQSVVLYLIVFMLTRSLVSRLTRRKLKRHLG